MMVKETFGYRYLDNQGNIVLMENNVSRAKLKSEMRLVNRTHYNITTESRMIPDKKTCHVVCYFQPK